MKAVVLLSGGIDSSTCLAIAVQQHGKENVSALSVSYGQKHIKEMESAKAIAEYYGVPLYTVDLSATYQFSNCSLLQHSDEAIEHKSYAEQKQITTYVPFRNGLMLSAAGALALSIYPDDYVKLYYGAHADDNMGYAYPDCSPAFVHSMSRALYEGSDNKLFVEAPFANRSKTAVVLAGDALKVPYEKTWSCYEGGEKHCGTCGTCIDRKKAFAEAGVVDPTEYKE